MKIFDIDFLVSLFYGAINLTIFLSISFLCIVAIVVLIKLVFDFLFGSETNFVLEKNESRIDAQKLKDAILRNEK